MKLSVRAPKVKHNLVAARQPLVPKRASEPRTPIRTGPTLKLRQPSDAGGGETGSVAPTPAPTPVAAKEKKPQPVRRKRVARKEEPKAAEPVEPTKTEPATSPTDLGRDTEPDETQPDEPDETQPDEGVAAPTERKPERSAKFTNRVFFSNASSSLSGRARAKLDANAKWLADNPDKTITIEGHTNSLGNPDLNVALSEQRAEAVKEYLVSRGVDASRITTKGYGSERLEYSPGSNPKNRRVVIVVD